MAANDWPGLMSLITQRDVSRKMLDERFDSIKYMWRSAAWVCVEKFKE